ncbi:MAG: hypothetical protein AAGE83_10810 [Pseudomonadota bacterium]
MNAVFSELSARRNDDLSAAIEEAAERCRESGSVGDLIRLRDLRLKAGAELAALPDTSWDNEPEEPAEDLFPDVRDGIPEVDLRELGSASLRSAMCHHGALIVRNMLNLRQAHEYRVAIDRVIEAAKAYQKTVEEDAEDVRPTAMKADYLPFRDSESGVKRRNHSFVASSGSIETLLSPSFSLSLFDSFERLGLRRLLQDYFRDEPCVSFQKCVLRRAEPLKAPAEWHQDGAFMDRDIKSLNLWIALSECGGGTDSPGMDLVPRRLDEVLEPGTNGAIFNWSISGATVAEKFPGLEPARPFFGPGDAIFFDHLNLHATSSDPSFTQPRYAIENWFFAKGRAATNQFPAVW